MWRLILILLPIAAYFMINWDSYSDNETATQPVELRSETFGVYEYRGYKATLYNILDRLENDREPGDRVVTISLKVEK